jgi:hypothetical protein
LFYSLGFWKIKLPAWIWNGCSETKHLGLSESFFEKTKSPALAGLPEKVGLCRILFHPKSTILDWKLQYYTAIIVRLQDGRAYGFVKYHRIRKDKQVAFQSFAKQKFPDAGYVNYYEKSDRGFAKRVYL